MAEENKQPVQEGKVIVTKRTRSFFFLIVSVVMILAINSLLPLIQGRTHYTVESVSMTYGEFEKLYEGDNKYNLSWGSKKEVLLYQNTYMDENPEDYLSYQLVPIPDDMPVEVYTKFFYEYPFWYISTATSLGSAVILFYSLFNYLIIVMKDKHEQFLKLEKQMEDTVDGQLHPSRFEPWMEFVFNYTRKINQHKANVRFQLDKLEQRTNWKIKRKLKEYFIEDIKTRTEPKNLKWSERRYLRKKERLLGLMDEDYIIDYVAHSRVKHFKYIHPAFIYSGANIIGRTIDSYSLVRTDGEQISNDAGKKVTTSLIITTLFAVVFTVAGIESVGQDPLTIALTMLSKVAPLLIQIPMAISYTNKFMEGHLVKNLLTRKAISLRFLEDVKNNVSLEDPTIRKVVKEDAETNNIAGGPGHTTGPSTGT